jgi:hypothetical protein
MLRRWRGMMMSWKRWTPEHMKTPQAKKKKHLTRRTSNYIKLEDEALIKAWDSITLDGVTGPIKPISGIDNGLRTSISISCLGLHIGHQGRTPHYKVDGMQSSLHVAGGPLALTK